MLRRFAVLTALLLAGPALAEDCGGVDLSADPAIKPDWSAHAEEMINGDGLLWRIDKPGLAPSYLYGTMHSTQAGPMRLAAEAAPYAEKARVVATELGAFDASQKIEVGSKMLRAAMSPDADSFAGLIEGGDASAVEAMLAAKGTTPEMAHHLKLWMLAVTASLPKCEIDGQVKGLPEVDESFARIAEAHHIPIVGLESVDEQLKVIGSISPALAASQLRTMAHGGAYADGGYATLLSLY
ncbi:MAG: TraB/GumN family protein, partial [Pseudomonadota bacterium]|nr:TraB/GumN family protein [Pseudomonadota bacterium]